MQFGTDEHVVKCEMESERLHSPYAVASAR